MSGWLRLARGAAVAGGLAFAIVRAHAGPAAILLPDGTPFASWERPLHFTKTYYVDNRNPHASDTNDGSVDRPFATIDAAAQVLRAGERVIIATGVYRERVSPARGGDGPESMISYEAAPGAEVVVKGSVAAQTGWLPSEGFEARPSQSGLYQLALEAIDLHGYNPFGMVNLYAERGPDDEVGKAPQGLRPVLLRRGMVFSDGERLKQVESYDELAATPGSFWCEENGMHVHVHLAGEANPAEHRMELVTREQVFAPRERYLGFIRIKGITFEQAANGFPRPQAGMVSTSRGHHWIIEDCTFRQANSIALDVGNQSTYASPFPLSGHMIVRRNHVFEAGICGIAGTELHDSLIEDNLIENVGWQDAESLWESAGIKLHLARNTVVRGNVIRHLRHAAGIWLDWDNRNSRVTANVVGDIQETLNGGIFLEASQQPNMIDQNIVWNVTHAPIGRARGIQNEGGDCIVTAGTDEGLIAHNLLGHCQEAAVRVVSEAWRMVMGRSGLGRGNAVLDNVFAQSGRSIDLPNEQNSAEGNLYLKPSPAGEEGRGLNWLATNETLRLDLNAWRKYFGFDKTGREDAGKIEIDLDRLEAHTELLNDPPASKTTAAFAQDFLGEASNASRPAGPFAGLAAGVRSFSIDPRAGGRESIGR